MRLFFSLLLAAITTLAAAQEALPLKLKDGSTLQVVDVRVNGKKVTVRTSGRQQKTIPAGGFDDPRANWQGAIQAARSQGRWVDAARSARMLASLYPKDGALSRQQGDLMRERDRKMADEVRKSLDKGDGRKLEGLVKAARTDAEYNSQFMNMVRETVAESLSRSSSNDYSRRANEYKALKRVFPDAAETKSLGQVVESLRAARGNGNAMPTPVLASGSKGIADSAPNPNVANPALSSTTPAPAANAPVAATAQVRELVETGRFAQAQTQVQRGLEAFPGDPVLNTLANEIGPKYIAWIQSIQGADGGTAMTAGAVPYRLYAPKAWGPAVRPPVLYVFSAEVEADVLVKELADFAERSAVFVVAAKVPISPWEQLQSAQSAITADAGSRLATEPRKSIVLGPPMASIGLAATAPGIVGAAIAVGTDLSNLNLTPRAPFPAVLLYPKSSSAAEADAAKAVPMYRTRGIMLTTMPYEGAVASLPPMESLQSAVSALSQDLGKPQSPPPPLGNMRRPESFY